MITAEASLMRRREAMQMLFAGILYGLPVLPAVSAAPGGKAFQETSGAEPLLPLFPLPLVLFPGVQMPLHIFEPRYKEMLRDCVKNNWEFGILLTRGDQFEHIGCTAAITEILRSYSDGRADILVNGRRRFEVSLLNRDKPYLRGRAEFFLEDQPASVDSLDKAPVDPNESKLRLQAVSLHGRLVKIIASLPPDPDAPQEQPQTPDRPAPEPSFDPNTPRLSFQMVNEIPANLDVRQEILELRSERERLAALVRYMERLIEALERRRDQNNPVRV
jgi:ATP-dependent Lon protease